MFFSFSNFTLLQEARFLVKILWELCNEMGSLIKWHPLTIKHVYILYALGTVFFILSFKKLVTNLTVILSSDIVGQVYNPLSQLWKPEYSNQKLPVRLAPPRTWRPNPTRTNGRLYVVFFALSVFIGRRNIDVFALGVQCHTPVGTWHNTSKLPPF